MQLLECFFSRPRPKEQQWIDVLVDIDDTLVYSGGGTLKVSGFLGLYRLAHGAVELLVALDRICGIRIGFYSYGAKLRNESLIKQVVAAIADKGHRMKQKLEVFSMAAGMYGKKSLKGLRKGMDLNRTILVEDGGKNMEAGEEANLLKIYENKHFIGELTDSQKLYKAGLANNLVQALQMILESRLNCPRLLLVQ